MPPQRIPRLRWFCKSAVSRAESLAGAVGPLDVMSLVDATRTFWSDFRRSLLPAGVISLAMCLITAIATWDRENPPLFNEILLCLQAFARAMVMLTVGLTWVFCLKRLKTVRSQQRAGSTTECKRTTE